MALMHTSAAADEYPSLFRAHLVRAVNYLHSVLSRSETPPSPDEQAQAFHLLDLALHLPELWPPTRALLLILAPRLEQAGTRERWMTFLERGIEQGRCAHDGHAEADLRLHLGVLCQLQAHFAEARAQFAASARYFEAVGEQPGYARALNRLAYVARHQREPEEATRLAQAALVVGPPAEQAYSYFVLGTVAYDQRAWAEANQWFARSLTLWEEAANPRLIAWGLTNQGTALRALKRHEEAITCYERSIVLLEAIDDPLFLAVARMNLGNVYLEREQFAQALALHTLAEPIFRQTLDRYHLAAVCTNIGMAHEGLHQWERAQHFLEASAAQWQGLANPRQAANALDSLGLVQLAQGQPARALATFKQALGYLAAVSGPDDPLYAELIEHQRQAQVHLDGLPSSG